MNILIVYLKNNVAFCNTRTKTFSIFKCVCIDYTNMIIYLYLQLLEVVDTYFSIKQTLSKFRLPEMVDAIYNNLKFKKKHLLFNFSREFTNNKSSRILHPNLYYHCHSIRKKNCSKEKSASIYCFRGHKENNNPPPIINSISQITSKISQIPLYPPE